MVCTLDIQQVQIGNKVRVTGTFTNAIDNYSPLDPGSTKVDIENPSGVEVSYQFGVDPEIVRTGIGVYYIEYTLDEVGMWYFRWYSFGLGEASTETPLNVIASRTYP